MIILDIILAIIILGAAFSGYKKGLSDILIKLIGLILAIICAFAFKGAIADFIKDNTSFDEGLKSTITSGINEATKHKTEETIGEIAGTENDSKDEDNKISESFYDKIISNIGVDETVDNLAENVVNFILNILGFVIIFVLITIITYILSMVLDMVFDLPVLSIVNDMGGLILGTAICLVKIWVVLAVLSMVTPMIPGIENVINQTYVIKMLYTNNFIVKIMAKGFTF